jgi:hypothetical protein
MQILRKAFPIFFVICAILTSYDVLSLVVMEHTVVWFVLGRSRVRFKASNWSIKRPYIYVYIYRYIYIYI